MATHSSFLAWRIPWTEEPGGLRSIGLQRVGHDCSDLAHTRAEALAQSNLMGHLPASGVRCFPLVLSVATSTKTAIDLCFS